jgi:predicted aspartyl protease
MPKRLKGEFVGIRPHLWFRFHGQRVRFMVDTGFDGDLLVTESQADVFKLQRIGDLEVSWFDGSKSAVEVAIGFIDWFGRPRRCSVLVADKGLTLLGMGLIQDARLEVDHAKDHVALIAS